MQPPVTSPGTCPHKHFHFLASIGTCMPMPTFSLCHVHFHALTCQMASSGLCSHLDSHTQKPLVSVGTLTHLPLISSVLWIYLNSRGQCIPLSSPDTCTQIPNACLTWVGLCTNVSNTHICSWCLAALTQLLLPSWHLEDDHTHAHCSN